MAALATETHALDFWSSIARVAARGRAPKAAMAAAAIREVPARDRATQAPRAVKRKVAAAIAPADRAERMAPKALPMLVLAPWDQDLVSPLAGHRRPALSAIWRRDWLVLVFRTRYPASRRGANPLPPWQQRGLV